MTDENDNHGDDDVVDQDDEDEDEAEGNSDDVIQLMNILLKRNIIN